MRPTSQPLAFLAPSSDAVGDPHWRDELGGVIERHRAAQEVTLRLLDPDRAQRLELWRGLDAFRHDEAVGVTGKRHQRGGERPARRIKMDMPRQPSSLMTSGRN